MIDLHLHSTCSDGSQTPEELADEAARRGLTAVALTDHETMAGTARLEAAARGRLRAVPGVEISATRPDGQGSLHLLGYFADPSRPAFAEAMERMRRGRDERNEAILRKLASLGMALDPEEVRAAAAGGFVGRLHIARVMTARGHVPDARAAFERWLKRGRPAYADRFHFAAAEAIRLIRDAGGVAVLAHPSHLKLTPRRLREMIRTLKAAGLGGIEVYYSDHNAARIRQYRVLAREEGMAESGGTDSHGAFTPDLHMGRGFGQLRIPDELVGALEQRRPA